MDWFSCGIFMTLVALCIVSGDQIEHTLNGNALKKSFNKLLSSLIRVNRDRLDTIGKLYELDNYKPQTINTYDDEPNVSGDQTDNNELNGNQIHKKFNKLLYVVKIMNQKRLDASKKMYELESYEPKSIGRTLDDDTVVAIITDGDDYNSNNVAYTNKLYNRGPKEVPSGTFQSTIKKFNKPSLDDETAIKTSTTQNRFNVKDVLRAWRGCNKSAAKACKKACKSAFKDVCSDYKCSRSMKRAYKRACKSSCSSRFDV